MIYSIKKLINEKIFLKVNCQFVHVYAPPETKIAINWSLVCFIFYVWHSFIPDLFARLIWAFFFFVFEFKEQTFEVVILTIAVNKNETLKRINV